MVLWRVLIAALPVALFSAVLGSGSAAQLSSPQGCSHLRHHLLITDGCLDYHTAFNGKMAFDESCNTQHKWCYKFCPFTVCCLSDFLVTPTSLWAPLDPIIQHKSSEETWNNSKKPNKHDDIVLQVALTQRASVSLKRHWYYSGELTHNIWNLLYLIRLSFMCRILEYLLNKYNQCFLFSWKKYCSWKLTIQPSILY